MSGKPVNIRHVGDAERIHNLGVLDDIMYGDVVTAGKKDKDPYQFKPKAGRWFAANQAVGRTTGDGS